VDNTHYISPDEIDVVVDLSIHENTNWEIIVGSPDLELVSFIKDIFKDDPQVSVKSFQSGCDLLVAMSKDIPDIVVIDEKIQDIIFTDVLSCIKRTPDFKDIYVYCNSDSNLTFTDSSYHVCNFISLDKKNRTNILRKFNSQLYLSTTHKTRRLQPEKERKWPRIDLNLSARIEIIDPTNNARYDYGDAQITNLSREGACISRIKLNKGRIPGDIFHIRLRVNQPPLEDWKADSKVIRMDNGTAAGLKFVDISKQDKNKIMNIFD